MIEQKESCNQLPKEIKPAFKELQVIKHLKDRKSTRNSGIPQPIFFSLFSCFYFIRRIGFAYLKVRKRLLSAPKVIVSMIDRAIAAGASASYTLMDSWFTHAPLIKEVLDRGLHVIGMIINDNKRYLVNGNRLDLKGLYLAAPKVEGKRSDIFRAIRTELVPGIPVLMVFIRHRSKKKEWLAILSTDMTLTVEEVIRIYSMCWDIEVFFKCAKSMLRLQKEFQGLSYDLLVSHTTIVFSRYILLAWQHRQSTDQRTLGGLFYLLCDEVGTMDWVVAL